jgi:hypothetical protein
MTRQHRFQLMAVAQRVAEINRLAAQYERDLLRDRDGCAGETEAVPSPRQRRRRRGPVLRS